MNGAFALTKIAFLHRELRAVRAVPSIGALKQIQVLRSISSGEDTYNPEGSPDGERIDMRSYSPGDPIRFEVWSNGKKKLVTVRLVERPAGIPMQ